MKKTKKWSFSMFSPSCLQNLCLYVVALLFLLLCLDIELECVLIPCDSPKIVEVTNKVILAISYSFISAVLFYFVVNDIPFRRRKGNITPLLRNHLFKIKDRLRNCKETVSPFVFDQPKNKEDFCKLFAEIELRESSFLNKDVSKFSVLEEYRSKITESLNMLLAYREYLDDDVFQEINKMLDSEFIKNGIILPPDIEDLASVNYKSNQKEVGECIYDLYEKFSEIIRKE